MQAAAGVVTRTGCLLYKDGKFLLQDQNTQEVLEIRGDNLAAQVGNRVTITGATSALRPTLTIASVLLNASSVNPQETGGCLSVAAALDAQTDVANPVAGNAPNQPAAAPAKGAAAGAAKAASTAGAVAAGMSIGAKIAIVAVVAGGGAGAAIALSSKKSSTSP
jgi:hypothetical protein